MTGPDLRAATAAFERLMDDVVTITRDFGGTSDAVLDRATGQLVQTPPATVYTGPAMFRPGGAGSAGGVAQSEQGGQYSQDVTATLYLPLSYLAANPAAEPRLRDEVVVTSSRRDPNAVGRRYEVTDVAAATLAVSRKCRMTHRGLA